MTTTSTVEDDHVLADSDWKIDLHIHVTEALEALMGYLGVEFEDGRLHEIALAAAVTGTNLVIDDVRLAATKMRELRDLAEAFRLAANSVRREIEDVALKRRSRTMFVSLGKKSKPSTKTSSGGSHAWSRRLRLAAKSRRSLPRCAS